MTMTFVWMLYATAALALLADLRFDWTDALRRLWGQEPCAALRRRICFWRPKPLLYPHKDQLPAYPLNEICQWVDPPQAEELEFIACLEGPGQTYYLLVVQCRECLHMHKVIINRNTSAKTLMHLQCDFCGQMTAETLCPVHPSYWNSTPADIL
jgi:hypothetical protein